MASVDQLLPVGATPLADEKAKDPEKGMQALSVVGPPTEGQEAVSLVDRIEAFLPGNTRMKKWITVGLVMAIVLVASALGWKLYASKSKGHCPDGYVEVVSSSGASLDRRLMEESKDDNDCIKVSSQGQSTGIEILYSKIVNSPVTKQEQVGASTSRKRLSYGEAAPNQKAREDHENMMPEQDVQQIKWENAKVKRSVEDYPWVQDVLGPHETNKLETEYLFLRNRHMVAQPRRPQYVLPPRRTQEEAWQDEYDNQMHDMTMTSSTGHLDQSP